VRYQAAQQEALASFLALHLLSFESMGKGTAFSFLQFHILVLQFKTLTVFFQSGNSCCNLGLSTEAV
jgi:hypothetical protein